MFQPYHCPNPECENFKGPRGLLWYQKRGKYLTITFGPVPRFRCKACHREFSAQTFSLDYYAKRLLDYRVIYNRINAGAGLRNIARDMNVRDAAISNRINRLARNALLAGQMIMSECSSGEDLAIDGLQNFCVSQYFPDNYTVIVGTRSQFIYDCDYATIRRGGRMTAAQKFRRAELEKRYRPSKKSVEQSFGRLLETVRMRFHGQNPLILYTDEKKEYQRVLWRTRRFQRELFSGQWRHHMTNSKLGRNQSNPLFPVNYVDREIRKDMAGQARETVQFTRNVPNAMLRMALYCFDHNFRKPYRIGNREMGKLRHAEIAGFKRWEIDQILSDIFVRRFFRRGEWPLSLSARMTLERKWRTPLKRGPEKVQKYMSA